MPGLRGLESLPDTELFQLTSSGFVYYREVSETFKFTYPPNVDTGIDLLDCRILSMLDCWLLCGGKHDVSTENKQTFPKDILHLMACYNNNRVHHCYQHLHYLLQYHLHVYI